MKWTEMKSTRGNFTWKNNIIVLLVIFSVFLGLFLYLLYEGINVISATQTFTAVNAQWTQTQKNAVNDLYIYARTHDESDFNNFQHRIDQVQAMRSAIDEIRGKDPDVAFIREGLSALQVSDALIKNMHSVGLYIGSLENFTAANALWEECGEKISMIEESAYTLHHRFQQGNLTEEELTEELEWIRRLDTSLTAEAQNILIQLGESTNWLKSRVLGIILFVGVLLILFASGIAYYWYKMTLQLHFTIKERDSLASFPKLNPLPVTEVDFNGNITYRNPVSEDIFPDMVSIQHPFLREVRFCIDNLDRELPETITKEVVVGKTYFDQVIRRVDNKKVFHIYALDVTPRKSYEQEIKKSLEEKEVLLSEIHHRVKNNLAVVSGLLELEAANMEDDRSLQAIRRSISRVHSIALVHEKLYEFEDFSNINVRTYLEKLTVMIDNTYNPPNKTITLHNNIEDVKLNVNQAVPLAILINEVLINIYKHAFNGFEKGEIIIDLTLAGDDQVRLLVKDNGSGFSSDDNLEEASSLGMTLIRTLAAQLKADISFYSENGTAFQMKFRKSEAKGSVSAHTVSQT